MGDFPHFHRFHRTRWPNGWPSALGMSDVRVASFEENVPVTSSPFPVRWIRAGLWGLCMALALLAISGFPIQADLGAPPQPVRGTAQPFADPMWVPGAVILRWEGASTLPRSMAARLGVGMDALRPVAIPGLAGLYRLRVPQGQEVAEARRLARIPGVRYAEPEYRYRAIGTALTPNDPLYPRYQWNLPHIRADRAWEVTPGRAEVVIAVVDTGVDLGHPDLASKLVPGYDFIGDDPDPQDDNGHGTHVASVAAAATHNGQGIAGVAWAARLMPIKALDATGTGTSVSIAAGIRWAVENGARVLNLSLGGPHASDLLREAVSTASRQGAVIVAATGNEYAQGNPITYPAALEPVLAVAAVDDQDGHASYSNSGTYVDLAAPGGDPTGGDDADPRHWITGAYLRDSGAAYAWLAGTSQAAPHVAGAAALLLSVDPGLTPGDVRRILLDSAQDVQEPGWDAFSGYGRLDVRAAVELAQGGAATATPAASPSPTPVPEGSPTPTPTPSPTATPTFTPSPTPTPTPPPRAVADTRVNSVVAGAQHRAALAGSPAGDTMAVWVDRRAGADILYSAVLASTASQWGANIPVQASQQLSATTFLGKASLALLPSGQVGLLWQTEDETGDPDVLFAQAAMVRTAWGNAVPVSRDPAQPIPQTDPALAATARGTLVAVWVEERPVSEGERRTVLYWSQRRAGAESWDAPRPLTELPSRAQQEPDLAADGETVYAVWVERESQASAVLVSYRLGVEGDWTAPVAVASSSPGHEARAPQIGVDGRGRVLVVWEDVRGAGQHPDLYAVHRLPDGRWSEPRRINDDPGDAPQTRPHLSAGAGGAVVAWEDGRNGDGDIYAAWLALDSDRWSANVRVNQDPGDAQQAEPRVALDRQGNTVVVWTDYRTGITAPEIYARFIPVWARFRLHLPMVANSP